MHSLRNLEPFCGHVQDLLNETFAGNAGVDFQAHPFSRDGQNVILILLGSPGWYDDFSDISPDRSSFVIDVPENLDNESGGSLEQLAIRSAEPAIQAIEKLLRELNLSSVDEE
jgi:hypothetical protein